METTAVPTPPTDATSAAETAPEVVAGRVPAGPDAASEADGGTGDAPTDPDAASRADGGTDDAPADPDVAPVVDADGALRLLDVDAAPPGTYGEFEPESPALIDAQGRVRLSFSRVESYTTCPRRFRYAYVDRLPGVPSPHLSFGTSIHSALEAFYDRKLPACPSEEELLGFLYESWDSSGFGDVPREQQLEFYRHAQDLLRRYHRRHAATYRLPAATEAWFELPIGYEAVVVGSIDRVDVDDEGRFHVIDYKTNRKVKDRARVAGSLQLAIYALACRHLFGSLPATVALEFVVPGVTVSVPIEDIDLERAREVVLDTAAKVRAEAYEPTPNRLCDWCDFQAICPAWEGDASVALGPAEAELATLRRQVARDVRALREAEAGVERLRAELAAREADDHPAPEAPEPAAAPEPEAEAGEAADAVPEPHPTGAR